MKRHTHSQIKHLLSARAFILLREAVSWATIMLKSKSFPKYYLQYGKHQMLQNTTGMEG